MPETTVTIKTDLQAERKLAAESFRDRMTERGTLVVNLVSSPGAGKTSLLQATAKHWGDSRKMAVLVGDLATDRDAERLAPFCPVQQLTTGGACHLELPLVQRGLGKLPPEPVEFLFIENIGNLVCPASHDLGEHLRVVALSTTEGDDKPGKYPKMFRTSDLMVITKTDLLPHVPFEVGSAVEDARKIVADLDVIEVCATQDAGIEAWCNYLDQQRAKLNVGN